MHAVSRGSISLPHRGSFRLSLTVLVHYRSVRVFSGDGPPYSDKVSRAPRPTRHHHISPFVYRTITHYGCGPFPEHSTKTYMTNGLFPRSLAATGESQLISFSLKGTEMFHFPSFPSYDYVIIRYLPYDRLGFPIQSRIWDVAPPRTYRKAITSFHRL